MWIDIFVVSEKTWTLYLALFVPVKLCLYFWVCSRLAPPLTLCLSTPLMSTQIRLTHARMQSTKSCRHTPACTEEFGWREERQREKEGFTGGCTRPWALLTSLHFTSSESHTHVEPQQSNVSAQTLVSNKTTPTIVSDIWTAGVLDLSLQTWKMFKSEKISKRTENSNTFYVLL